MRNQVLTRANFELRIRDLLSSAKICKLSHSDIYKRFRDTIAVEMNREMRNGRRVYSRALAAYVQGYFNALINQLWQSVEFCYRDTAGVIYSTHKNSARRNTEEFYSSGRGCELGQLESAHLWIDSDKPFTTWAHSSARTNTGNSEVTP